VDDGTAATWGLTIEIAESAHFYREQAIDRAKFGGIEARWNALGRIRHQRSKSRKKHMWLRVVSFVSIVK
jgi:hypothetical protein